MATVNVNFRLEEALDAKARERAGEVKYRTFSDYMRELIEADLKKAAAEKGKQ